MMCKLFTKQIYLLLLILLNFNAIWATTFNENIQRSNPIEKEITKTRNTTDPAALYTYTRWAGESTITGFNSDYITNTLGGVQPTDLTLPPVDTTGTPITAIGYQAFWAKKLTSIIIGDSVTSIKEQAFRSCDMVRMELPSSLTSIGAKVFYSNKLTEIVIPESLTSLGEGAFYGNPLTNLTFSPSLTTIPPECFAGNKLQSIVIPDGITSVGERAFSGSIAISLSLPNSLVTIGDFAFQYSSFESVIIPDSVTTIGECAFRSDDSNSQKISFLTIGQAVETIEDSAFLHNNLKTVKIPASVKTIEHRAFEGNPLDTIVFEGHETRNEGFRNYSQPKYYAFPYVTYYLFETGSPERVNPYIKNSANEYHYKVYHTVKKGTYTTKICTITYNLDGGSGNFPSQTIPKSYALPLSSVEPTKPNNIFKGWSDADGSVFASGEDVVFSDDVTLTAQWEAVTPVIGFESSVKGSTLTWTVEEEIGVKEYVIKDTSGKIITTVIADGSSSYRIELAEGITDVVIEIVDNDGSSQTYAPEDGNKQITFYDLEKGWNLIAITADNADLTELKKASSGAIWAWNGESYTSVESAGATNAVWVYMNSAKQVKVTGTKSNATIKLSSGWNLVGPAENCRAPEKALSTYSWESNNEMYQNINKDSILQEGSGYWIFSF